MQGYFQKYGKGFREFQVDIRKIEMLNIYMKALCLSKQLSTVTVSLTFFYVF